jgi:hypothetical protein
MDISSDWHLALHVTDFSGAYMAVEAGDLLLREHPYFEQVSSLDDALKYDQFRFRYGPPSAVTAWPLSLCMYKESVPPFHIDCHSKEQGCA